MIKLVNIYKDYGFSRARKKVLRGVDALFDFSEGNIGILGKKKSGKTTLGNIIAGTIKPTQGHIYRSIRVSWPVSWRGIGGDTPGDAIISFFARVYQIDRKSTLEFVADLAGLEKKIYKSFKEYSASEKNRFMQALLIALSFDVYFIDESLPPIDSLYKQMYDAVWSDCLKNSRILATSSNPKILSKHCDNVALLFNGQLSEVMSRDSATQVFKQAIVQERKKLPQHEQKKVSLCENA